MFTSKKHRLRALRNELPDLLREYDLTQTLPETKLGSVMGDLYSSLDARDFDSRAELDEILTAFQGLPDFQGAVLLGQIVLFYSELFAAKPLGEYVNSIIVTTGLGASRRWAAEASIHTESKDAAQICNALSIFWTGLKTPYREFEEAQASYMIGWLAFQVDSNKIRFLTLLRQAHDLLYMVHPELIENADRRDELVASVAQNRNDWASTIELLESYGTQAQ